MRMRIPRPINACHVWWLLLRSRTPHLIYANMLLMSSVCLEIRPISSVHRLVGPVVKASASRAEEPGFDSRLHRGDFFGSSRASDLKICTRVSTLPGTRRYRVSAATGWRGVSILWLGESLICNFNISLAACRIVWADPSLRHTRMLLLRCASNQPAQTFLCSSRPYCTSHKHPSLCFFFGHVWTTVMVCSLAVQAIYMEVFRKFRTTLLDLFSAVPNLTASPLSPQRLHWLRVDRRIDYKVSS